MVPPGHTGQCWLWPHVLHSLPQGQQRKAQIQLCGVGTGLEILSSFLFPLLENAGGPARSPYLPSSVLDVC